MQDCPKPGYNKGRNFSKSQQLSEEAGTNKNTPALYLLNNYCNTVSPRLSSNEPLLSMFLFVLLIFII
jgi:hypothetical protein